MNDIGVIEFDAILTTFAVATVVGGAGAILGMFCGGDPADVDEGDDAEVDGISNISLTLCQSATK